MCLIPQTGKLEVAKRNFSVYKWLRVDSNGDRFSPYRDTPWKLNTLVEVKTRLWGDYKKSSVNKGLHAFTNSHKASARLASNPTLARGTKLFLCTIPKGAIYKLGIHGDIVSNQLIVRRLWVPTKK